MNKRYLIASDLDGTLLNDEHKLSERTLNQLRHMREQGHEIVAVTGRSYLSALEVLQQTDVIDLIICSNGAYQYSLKTGEITNQRVIQFKEWSRWISDLKQSITDVCFAWETIDGVFYDPDFLRLAGMPSSLHIQEKARPADGQELLKLLIRSFRHEANVLQNSVREILRSECEVSTSGAPFVEATARGTDKGNALARLSDQMQIKQELTVAFGDNYNDESMIRWAGRSYAMGNAVDKIKELANHQTLSNSDDGVAVALEKLSNT